MKKGQTKAAAVKGGWVVYSPSLLPAVQAILRASR